MDTHYVIFFARAFQFGTKFVYWFHVVFAVYVVLIVDEHNINNANNEIM